MTNPVARRPHQHELVERGDIDQSTYIIRKGAFENVGIIFWWVVFVDGEKFTGYAGDLGTTDDNLETVRERVAAMQASAAAEMAELRKTELEGVE